MGGEQGWLNEVYLWEKFDIGLEFNVRTGVMQVRNNAPSLSLAYQKYFKRRKEE